MQFESFDWLNHYGIGAIITWQNRKSLVHLHSVAFFLQNKVSTLISIDIYFVDVFNKTIIPIALVGYEMIIANSALRASLAIYHLISNTRSWNNC